MAKGDNDERNSLFHEKEHFSLSYKLKFGISTQHNKWSVNSVLINIFNEQWIKYACII